MSKNIVVFRFGEGNHSRVRTHNTNGKYKTVVTIGRNDYKTLCDCLLYNPTSYNYLATQINHSDLTPEEEELEYFND